MTEWEKKVRFTMRLYYDGGIIRGEAMDEEAEEFFAKPAQIEGTFENGVLEFYHTYRMDALIRTNFNPHNYSDNSIQYKGNLKKKIFSRVYYFEGTWEISGSYLEENGNPYYYSGGGTWKMKKKLIQQNR